MKNIFSRDKTFSIILSVFLSFMFVFATVSAATTISTNITTGGTLNVTGASTLTGAATLSSTLDVTGATTLNGNITLGDAVTDSITSNGYFTQARVGTGSTFGHVGTIGADELGVEGDVEFDGTAWFDGVLHASSTALLGGALTTYGNSTFGDAAGDVNLFTGTLQASTTALFTSGLTSYGTISLQNAETISNATDGVIQLGGIASTTSLTLLNGETITNATDGIITLTGQAAVSATRVSGDYAYGFDINTDTFFTGGAAQKSYLLSVRGDRTVSYAASGDSNDAYIKISGNNYAANDSNFILRGVNTGINNRSGGTLGILEAGSFGAQNKSGGTSPTVRGLTVTPENYGTTATEFGGIDIVLKNESNATPVTTSYGIRVRDIEASAQPDTQAGYLLSTASNGGFNYGIDLDPASINIADIRLESGDTIVNASASSTVMSGTFSSGILTAATTTATTALVIPSGTTPSDNDACGAYTAGALFFDTNAAAGAKLIICDGTNWILVTE